MTLALLSVEGMVILVLAVLVVALLRSHTLIVARLSRSATHPSFAWPAFDHFSPIPTGRPGRSTPQALRGISPTGEGVIVPIVAQIGGADPGRDSGAEAGYDSPGVERSPARRAGARTAVVDTRQTAPESETNEAGDSQATKRWSLLFFLSSDCMSCEALWKGLGDPRSNGVPDYVRPIVVTHSPERERISEIRALARPAMAASVPVVMADDPWADFEILGASTVVLVDATGGRVVGESAATGWSHVTDLVAHAVPVSP